MREEPKPIAVFDTGIMLQAAINPAGPAASALDQFDQEKVTVYLSPRLRSEWEDVLMRPSLRAKNPQITDAQVEAALQRFDARAIMVPNPPTYLVYPRDPDDEPVINLAIHVKASYLVTRDRDLLDLMDETRSEGRGFRRRFPDLIILDPVAFVRRLTAERQPEPEIEPAGEEPRQEPVSDQSIES
jgi:putative PIN family toxin of toxin-antitoxin system